MLVCPKEMGVCPWGHLQNVSQLTSCSPPAQTPHKLDMARPRSDLFMMSRITKSMPWPTDTARVVCLSTLHAAVPEAATPARLDHCQPRPGVSSMHCPAHGRHSTTKHQNSQPSNCNSLRSQTTANNQTRQADHSICRPQQWPENSMQPLAVTLSQAQATWTRHDGLLIDLPVAVSDTLRAYTPCWRRSSPK